MFQTFTSVSDERRKINRGKGQILMGTSLLLESWQMSLVRWWRIDQSEWARQRGTTGTKALWLELTSMSSKSLHKTGLERKRQWASWFWTGYCPLPLSWWAWPFSFQFSHFFIFLAFQLLLSTQAFGIAWKHYNICHPLNQWFNLLWRLLLLCSFNDSHFPLIFVIQLFIHLFSNLHIVFNLTVAFVLFSLFFRQVLEYALCWPSSWPIEPRLTLNP